MSSRPIVLSAPDRATLGDVLASRTSASKEARTLADLIVGLSESVVVRPSDVPASVVTLNSRVRIRTVGTDAVHELTIVAGVSDPRRGRTSVLTPVGAALLGRREGDLVECEVPAGWSRFRIEAVAQPERSEFAAAA